MFTKCTCVCVLYNVTKIAFLFIFNKFVLNSDTTTDIKSAKNVTSRGTLARRWGVG